MDIKSRTQRSFNMSRIKSKNTKPEVELFSLLKRSGVKFRKHYPILGKPDVAFPELKIAVFVDGEFWHGKNFQLIKRQMPDFWVKKIGGNIKRDRRVERTLRSKGWHIMRLWDKKFLRNPINGFQRVVNFLKKYENHS